MYKLISGKEPFNEPNLEDEIRCDDPAFFGGRWTNVSSDAKDFIKKLLIKSPGNRMTAYASLDHPFLAPIKERKLGMVRGMKLNEDIFRQLTGYRGISQLKKAALNLLIKDTIDKEQQGQAVGDIEK